MARRGRKPAPTPLKVLAGTRADRINHDEPRAPQGRPERPAHLSDRAREEWDRIVPQLEELGVLTKVDGAALSLYCGALAEMLDAQDEVAVSGMLIETGKGGLKANPAVAIARTARGHVHRLLVEFGLTPSSRSRLKSSTPAESRDALADFLSRKTKKV